MCDVIKAMERCPEQKLLLYAMACICMRWHTYICDGVYMYAMAHVIHISVIIICDGIRDLIVLTNCNNPNA